MLPAPVGWHAARSWCASSNVTDVTNAHPCAPRGTVGARHSRARVVYPCAPPPQCLSANCMGDRGMISLAAAAAEGAFSSLHSLVLERNAIGNVGMGALAAAISEREALPACVQSRMAQKRHYPILLMDNPGDRTAVHRAIDSRCKKAAEQHEKLYPVNRWRM